MIKFADFLQTRNINVNGVIHIGAHKAEEEPEYLRLVSEKNKIVWIEANPLLAESLHDSERQVICALITDKDNEERDFIITNNPESNSVLELEEHKKIFPWVFETGRVKMKTSTIDTLLYEKVVREGINMLAMDIQGAELLALKGSDKCLHHFDIVYSEINLTHVYKDCALLEELDAFLEGYGFYRAETLVLNDSWGDAIYLKKPLETCIKEGEDLGRVWDLLKHKVSSLVDVGAKDSQYPKEEALQCEYHLFEPNIQHFNNLYTMYADNKKVFLSNIALGDKRGQVSYYPDSESINPRFFGKETVININQNTLDNYCEKMDIHRINFLKIDTEGHELNVMKGANKILQNTDYVLFEYGGTYPDAGITFAEVYQILFEKGFKYIYYIGKNCLLYQPSPVEHKQYSNYIAMRTTWREAIKPLPEIAISCINLEKSIERRKFAIEQLNKLGLPYTIFRAVDGKRIDVVDGFACYEDMKFPIGHKKLSYGEMGCFISHIILCKYLLKTNNKYFLILEDDNEIFDINLVRQQLFNIPDVQFDMCFMSASMNSPVFAIEKINDYYYKTTASGFNRTNAILYTRNGLEKIVSNFEEKGLCEAYDNFLATLRFNIITANKLLFCCAEGGAKSSAFRSDIWNIYRENELYNDIRHDKHSYNGKLTMDLNGYARMGNCLFQYAFMKAQAIEKAMKIVLPDKCRELSAFPNIKHDIGTVPDNILLRETMFSYEKDLCDKISSHGNYSFGGYYQSEKYFEKYKDIIADNFLIDYRYMNFAKRLYTLLSGGKKLCGVHIRLPDCRGDHCFLYSVPTAKFISQAIAKIIEKEPQTRFVVCSSDMEECRRLYLHLFPPQTVFSLGGKYEDFALLSFCDNNIITSGSFGWWAAYLNKTRDKLVVCITPNFNPATKHEYGENRDERDYYPKDWVKVEN
jgi:FkbM family methyltransferase